MGNLKGWKPVWQGFKSAGNIGIVCTENHGEGGGTGFEAVTNVFK